MNKILKVDWILLVSVALLLAIGLLALYSISATEKNVAENFFTRQIMFVGIGFIVMLLFSSFNTQYFRLHGTSIYFITLFILGGVLIWGSTIRGTSGWIGIGLFNIQPVEIAKLSLIILLASFISQKRFQLGESVRIIASLVLTAIMVLLVLWQPDVGSAVILAGIWLGMVLVSGISKKHFFIILMIGLISVATTWFLLADYQRARLLNVVRPEIDPQGTGYNVIQSIIAIGSGGPFGKGIGHGSQSQLNFLPEKHTDFIFAVIAEEIGLIGSFFILFLYAVILYRMKKIAYFSQDNFSYLVTAGVMIMFTIQILINVGMNIGIVPVTGIPLPFLSYGGSSLLVSFAAIGIILGIYKRKKTILGTKVTQSY